MPENMERFFGLVETAARQGVLVKMTISKPVSKSDELRNVYVKPVLIKDRSLFAFTYRYTRRDEAKNYDMGQMMCVLTDLLSQRFRCCTLFTVEEDITLLLSSKGKATIQNKRTQEKRLLNLAHDKQKQRLLDPSNQWWFQLGLTTRDGAVTAAMQHKFKQICRYAEIVEKLLASLSHHDVLNVVDMGAGKGYLTFALYELLVGKMGLKTNIIRCRDTP